MNGTSETGATTLINYALLLFLGCAWGSSFLFVEIALTSITPVTIAAGRILVGALILLAAARAMRQAVPTDWRTLRLFPILGVTSHVAPFTLISVGQVHIDSGLAAILISTVPLFTLVMAHFYTHDDRVTPPKLVGVLLGFAGIILLIGPAALGGLSRGFWGQLMIVGAAFGFAATTLIARMIRHVPPVVSGAYSLACAAVVIIPLGFVFEDPMSLRPGWDALAGLAALAVISTALGMLGFFRLTKTAGPNFIALNNYIAPAVGVLWGVALLGESLSWRAIAALAMIFVGIAVSNLRWPAGAATRQA